MAIGGALSYPLNPTRDLSVSLAVGEDTLQGTVQDLLGSELVAEFDRDPMLRIGSRRHLTFKAPDLKEPIVSLVAVTLRSREQDKARYGFVFLDPTELNKRLTPALYKLFNRRHTCRVQTPAPIRIKALGENQAVLLGEVDDLSAGGVGAFFPVDVDRIMTRVERLQIRLDLPDTAPMQINGIIRVRQLNGDKVRYGIEFDPQGTKNFEAKTDAIMQLVLRTRRAWLNAAWGDKPSGFK
jgi:hypothetical protein